MDRRSNAQRSVRMLLASYLDSAIRRWCALAVLAGCRSSWQILAIIFNQGSKAMHGCSSYAFRQIWFLCVMDVLILSSTVAAVSPEFNSSSDVSAIRCPTVSKELLDRMQLDQSVRMKLLHASQEKGMDLDKFASAFPQSPLVLEAKRVDSDNRKWLAQFIDTHGWPGRSLVGDEAAHAAWLLVQHAGQDLTFQKKCLALMQKAEKGEVAPADIAYLIDRTRVAEGKKQLYGTQLEIQDQARRVVLKPVEDPDRLDELRQGMGLPPIHDYLQQAEQVLTLPNRSDPTNTSSIK